MKTKADVVAKINFKKVNGLYAFTNNFQIIWVEILIVTHPTLQGNCSQTASEYVNKQPNYSF